MRAERQSSGVVNYFGAAQGVLVVGTHIATA
jgi:hypothetical protein